MRSNWISFGVHVVLMYAVEIVLKALAVVVIVVRPAGAIRRIQTLAQARLRVPLFDVALLQALRSIVQVLTFAPTVASVVLLQGGAVLFLDSALTGTAHVLFDYGQITVLEARLRTGHVLQNVDRKGPQPSRRWLAGQSFGHAASAAAFHSCARRAVDQSRIGVVLWSKTHDRRLGVTSGWFWHFSTRSFTISVAEDTMIDGVLLDQALIEHVVAAADIAQCQGELQRDIIVETAIRAIHLPFHVLTDDVVAFIFVGVYHAVGTVTATTDASPIVGVAFQGFQSRTISPLGKNTDQDQQSRR